MAEVPTQSGNGSQGVEGSCRQWLASAVAKGWLSREEQLQWLCKVFPEPQRSTLGKQRDYALIRGTSIRKGCLGTDEEGGLLQELSQERFSFICSQDSSGGVARALW